MLLNGMSAALGASYSSVTLLEGKKTLWAGSQSVGMLPQAAHLTYSGAIWLQSQSGQVSAEHHAWLLVLILSGVDLDTWQRHHGVAGLRCDTAALH